MLRFGSPNKHQLNLLPRNVIDTPAALEYHPFCYFNFKEQAYIRNQAEQQTAECILTCGMEFYMDFGFLLSSTDDYKQPNKATDQMVMSYDGYFTHLVIMDGASNLFGSS
jgi:hypothetical protein